MTVQEFYASIGGGYENAKSIMMRDSFIERMILKFPADRDTNSLMESLREAAKTGDSFKAFEAVHGLKSVTGNLGFMELYKAVCELVEQLRPVKNDPSLHLDIDQSLLAAVETQYQKVIDALGRYAAERGQ